MKKMVNGIEMDMSPEEEAELIRHQQTWPKEKKRIEIERKAFAAIEFAKLIGDSDLVKRQEEKRDRLLAEVANPNSTLEGIQW